MADGQTANFHWTLPENHVNTNLWGGQNNANWQDADTKVYANQQNVNAILGQTSTATVSNVQVASTASRSATVSFTNSTAPAGQQLRWLWGENTTAEAAGNVGSDIALNAYSNTGAYLRTNIYVQRSNGAVTFSGAASFASTLTCTAAMSCKSTVSITATNASDNAYVGFFNSAGTRQGYVGWLNAGDHIELNADGGANIVVTGGIALNGNVTGAGSASFAGGVVCPGLTVNGGANITGALTSGSATVNFLTSPNTINCPQVNCTNASGTSSFYGLTATSLSASSLSVSGSSVIGNTSVTGNLSVAGLVTVSGIISSSYGYAVRAGTAGPTGPNAFNINWAVPNAQLWMDGVNVGTIAFVSDYRVKQNVSPLPSMWAKVRALKPISYALKDYSIIKADPGEKWGFIAHELQETLIMDAATGRKNQENLIQSPNPWTVIAALTGALQEAMTRIEALEAKAA